MIDKLSTKDLVRNLLWQSGGRFLSGSELAKTLSVSRTAVWKAIEQLRREGYSIESVTNRGYRLSQESDVLSEEGIRRYLKTDRLSIRVAPSISSTNTVLKGLAAEGAPEGLALVAGAQTAGRGRLGRSFYSPTDSGVYLSLLLRPETPAGETTKLTACAAVAVAEAVEALSGKPAGIKWVNDVLLDGKKVCGILTEASLDCESGRMDYVVVGIGINARSPKGGFPEDLRDTAGSVFGEEAVPELRCRLAAAVLDRLWDSCGNLNDSAYYDAYKKRSVVLGKEVNILAFGKDPEPAVVLDIDRDFSLLVRCADGSTRRLSSGEVSIRVRQQERNP